MQVVSLLPGEGWSGDGGRWWGGGGGGDESAASSNSSVKLTSSFRGSVCLSCFFVFCFFFVAVWAERGWVCEHIEGEKKSGKGGGGEGGMRVLPVQTQA